MAEIWLDNHGPHSLNYNDYGDHLTFVLTTLSSPTVFSDTYFVNELVNYLAEDNALGALSFLWYQGINVLLYSKKIKVDKCP